MERFLYLNERLIDCHHNPAVKQLVYLIRQDNIGGEPLRKRLFTLAQMLGNVWLGKSVRTSYQEIISPHGALQQPFIQKDILIIAVPRSGMSMGDGLNSLLPSYPYFITNNDVTKNPDESILPEDFPRSKLFEEVLIADGVIVTGRTINETIQAILSNISVNYFSVFTVLALKSGVEKLLDMYPNLTIYAGDIETKTKTVWDQHRYRLVETLYGIGNMGALVSR